MRGAVDAAPGSRGTRGGRERGEATVALIKLSAREMVKLGNDLIRPGGAERIAIEAVPAARGLISTIQRANEGLASSQAPSGSEAAALSDEMMALDVRHDDLVRAIDGRLESEYYATEDEVLRKIITIVRAAVFASGRNIIQRTYMEEAGEVVMRDARVTAEHHAFLEKLTTYEGRTLEELYVELQAVATKLGELEKRRQQLDKDGALVTKSREARYQWIRAINALIAVLESENVDAGPILADIRAAEAKAERRAATSSKQDSTDTDAADVSGTDTDATDTEATDTDVTDVTGRDESDVLDPPVPTDVVDPSGTDTN